MEFIKIIYNNKASIMEEKKKLGYLYDDSTIKSYLHSKIYEVVSNKLKLKYLGSTTNSLDNILHNYRLDKKRYDDGEVGFNEVFLLLDDADVHIELVENVICSGKRELDLAMTKYLRDHRLEYINICLYQRTSMEFKSDIIAGIEDRFVKKYRSKLGSDKFDKYLAQLECFKGGLTQADLDICMKKVALK